MSINFVGNTPRRPPPVTRRRRSPSSCSSPCSPCSAWWPRPAELRQRRRRGRSPGDHRPPGHAAREHPRRHHPAGRRPVRLPSRTCSPSRARTRTSPTRSSTAPSSVARRCCRPSRPTRSTPASWPTPRWCSPRPPVRTSSASGPGRPGESTMGLITAPGRHRHQRLGRPQGQDGDDRRGHRLQSALLTGLASVGLSYDDVKTVNVPAAQISQALPGSGADAAILIEPLTSAVPEGQPHLQGGRAVDRHHRSGVVPDRRGEGARRTTPRRRPPPTTSPASCGPTPGSTQNPEAWAQKIYVEQYGLPLEKGVEILEAGGGDQGPAAPRRPDRTAAGPHRPLLRRRDHPQEARCGQPVRFPIQRRRPGGIRPMTITEDRSAQTSTGSRGRGPPVAGFIGAEISGVDLASELSDAEVGRHPGRPPRRTR